MIAKLTWCELFSYNSSCFPLENDNSTTTFSLLNLDPVSFTGTNSKLYKKIVKIMLNVREEIFAEAICMG